MPDKSANEAQGIGFGKKGKKPDRRGSIAPRNAKELAKLMAQDSALVGAIQDVVVDADMMIEKKALSALRKFLRGNDVDLSFMGHGDVTEALNRFYREARLIGKFVRMW